MYLGRPWGVFRFSLSGFERIIFRNVFQRVLRAILVMLHSMSIYEAGYILLFLVSVYKVPFSYW